MQRLSRRLGLLFLTLLAVIAAGCTSESPTEVDVAEEAPAAEPAPTPLPRPTTEPVLLPGSPKPTPITLRGGQGIQAPSAEEVAAVEAAEEAAADQADEADNYAEAAAESPAAAAQDDQNDQASASEDEDTTAPGYDEAAASGPAQTETETAETATPEPATPATAAEPTVAPTPVPPPPATSDPIAISNGAEVWSQECARCHGAGGEGVPGIAGPFYFVDQRYTPPSLVNELTNGHAFTFGFADTLSAAEISDVVAFVFSDFSS